MKKYIAIILLFLVTFFVNGQEKLLPLTENVALKNKVQLNNNRQAALDLPFFDDFYPTDIYPNTTFWEDNLVYVNAFLPVEPPTIGVATFDGLNALGDPYSIVEDDYGVADFLTSVPIDLSDLTNDDDVYLSFFWQPQGIGEEPDFDLGDAKNQDYLMVEFLDSIGNWDTVWSVTGDTLHPFQQEFLQVVDSFLHDNFQFRFKTIGRLTGAIDHWHVDYVKLDKNRDPIIEQNIPELAYQYYPTSLLEPYYVMPYNQFDSTYLVDTHRVFIRNNFIQATTDIIDFYKATELSTAAILDDYAGPSADIGPELSFTEDYNMFSIPENLSEDTVTIRVDYRFLVSAEDTSNVISTRNNQITKDQVFSNFYAYDDGTAERAYALEVRSGDALYGRAALKYEVKNEDTLQAIKMHLVNFNEDLDDITFDLYIWKEMASDTTQENILYYQPDIVLADLPPGDTNATINNFTFIPILPEYITSEDQKLLIEGEFYVGYEVGIDVNFPIGFDLNTDGSDFHFYDFGLGWYPTGETGSLMINPVLGDALPEEYVTNVNDNILETFKFKMYPNPTSNLLKIETALTNSRVEVIDMLGRTLLQQNWNRNGSINVYNLKSGVYILRILDLDSGQSASSTFIKQ